MKLNKYLTEIKKISKDDFNKLPESEKTKIREEHAKYANEENIKHMEQLKANKDNHANQKNPNSKAHKAAVDNRANQKNPNNKATKSA